MLANVKDRKSQYIDNQTNRGKWIFGQAGISKRVEFSARDVARAVKDELSVAPTKSSTICVLHNHPVEDFRSANFITKEQELLLRTKQHKLSIPPSIRDTRQENVDAWKDILEDFREQGTSVDVRLGEVDPASLTYFRPIKDEDIRREFPNYLAEVNQRKKIEFEWGDTIDSLLIKLNETELDELHRHSYYRGKYDRAEYAKFNKFGLNYLKRMDLFSELSDVENSKVAEILLKHNPEALKLKQNYMDVVKGGSIRNRIILRDVLYDWLKTSMTTPTEKLPFSKEYSKLREAYARNGAYIRLVPHKNIPNEPPCAGTNYKP